MIQTARNDFNVGYKVDAYTRETGGITRILGELHQNIRDGFAEAGVEILSPTHSALRDGGAASIPSQAASADG